MTRHTYTSTTTRPFRGIIERDVSGTQFGPWLPVLPTDPVVPAVLRAMAGDGSMIYHTSRATVGSTIYRARCR